MFQMKYLVFRHHTHSSDMTRVELVSDPNILEATLIIPNKLLAEFKEGSTVSLTCETIPEPKAKEKPKAPEVK